MLEVIQVTGDVYDYNSLYIKIMSGELKKVIFFTSDEEYQDALKMGMRIGKSVIFDNDTDEIIKFFQYRVPLGALYIIVNIIGIVVLQNGSQVLLQFFDFWLRHYGEGVLQNVSQGLLQCNIWLTYINIKWEF